VKKLAPHLPSELVPEVLAAGWDEWDLCAILAAVAPYRPAAEQPQAMADALVAVAKIKNSSERRHAFNSLVSNLPPTLLREALALERSLDLDQYGPRTLALLASRLPESLLAECLEWIGSIPWEDEQAKLLVDVAPYLTPDLRPRALTTALTITNAQDRARAMAALAAHLLPPLQHHAIEAWLSMVPLLKRHEALKTLWQMLSVLMHLLTETDVRLVARSIIDVGEWWP